MWRKFRGGTKFLVWEVEKEVMTATKTWNTA